MLVMATIMPIESTAIFSPLKCRRLQGLQDVAEEGSEILEHFEFEPPDKSMIDKHQLVR